MGKGYKREAINYVGIMHRIPDIMSLDLTRKGNNWEGRYYIDGSRHPYRRNKLQIKMWKRADGTDIMVYEQGGDIMTLQRWLVEYGGAVDTRTAWSIMKGNSVPIREFMHHNIRENGEGLYVPADVYEEYRGFALETCNLYNFMCRLFGEERVKEIWDKYCVTTDHYGNACFWVRDIDGNICHDKRIKYMPTGKRDKSFGAMRKFKVGDGYTNKAYFGSHLIEEGKPINVTESEKSCLLGALYYGGIWISCGGKGNLRDVDENMILYSDLDAVEEWSQKGGTLAEWWLDSDCEGLDENADIGDLIVKKQMKV